MKEILSIINTQKDRLVKLNAEAYNRIKDIIVSVGEEHRINRINETCFMVNKSDMVNNTWCASYYDWRASAKLLLDKFVAFHEKNNIISVELFLEYLTNLRDNRKCDTCYMQVKSGSVVYTAPINALMVEKILKKTTN